MQGVQAGDVVAPDRPVAQGRKGLRHALGGKRVAQHLPAGIVVGNDGNAGCIALVAGARVRQVVDQGTHRYAPVVITCGLTQSRGISTASTAMISLAPRLTGPPAP